MLSSSVEAACFGQTAAGESGSVKISKGTSEKLAPANAYRPHTLQPEAAAQWGNCAMAAAPTCRRSGAETLPLESLHKLPHSDAFAPAPQNRRIKAAAVAAEIGIGGLCATGTLSRFA